MDNLNIINEKDIVEIIKKIQKEHIPEERIKFREQYENKAIEIIENNINNLSKENIKEILTNLDKDISSGKIKNARFGQMISPNISKILDNDLKNLRNFFINIYKNENLDGYETVINQLKYIKEGICSSILYLKNRNKYNLYLIYSTVEGIKKIFPNESDFSGTFKEKYLEFNSLVDKLKEICSRNNLTIKPQEIDLILTIIIEKISTYTGRITEQTKKDFEKIQITLLSEKKQIILYGPPGTGKTYQTKKIAIDLVGEKSGNL
jgi:Cdc6-like AAA superfamily ATPase